MMVSSSVSSAPLPHVQAEHPLATLLALEARPRHIAVWAPPGNVFRTLRHRFPQASVRAIDAAHDARGADAIVVAPTLARAEPVSSVELLALVNGLPVGGHLAFMQQTLTVSLPFAQQWFGVKGASALDPDVEALLAQYLRPLHRSEGSRAFGVWREVLGVGRKGAGFTPSRRPRVGTARPGARGWS